MTLVTGTVQDLGYDGMEGTLWARPARFRSDGQVVYAPERKPYKVVDGVVSADLAPGPAVLELQVGSHARGTFEVVIPEEDTTLADLLDTVFAWEPAQVSLFVAARDAAVQAKADAEQAATLAGTAKTGAELAAQQTGQDRAHVDQVRTELDEAFDESTAGNVLPPRLTETALNATYGGRSVEVLATTSVVIGVDMTAAIQALLNALPPAEGGTVTLPTRPFPYRVDGQIIIGPRQVLHLPSGVELLRSAANTSRTDPMIVLNGNHARLSGEGLVRTDNDHPHGIVMLGPQVVTKATYDAATTAGDTTLTCASGPFTAGDAGKAITVWTAGAGGGKLATTISAFISATQVTLATAAASTVAADRCYWGESKTVAWAQVGAVRLRGAGTSDSATIYFNSSPQGSGALTVGCEARSTQVERAAYAVHFGPQANGNSAISVQSQRITDSVFYFDDAVENIVLGGFVHQSLSLQSIVKGRFAIYNIVRGVAGEPGSGRPCDFDSLSNGNSIDIMANATAAYIDNGVQNTIWLRDQLIGQRVHARDGLTLPVRSTAFTDDSFARTPTSGTLGMDTAGSSLCGRVGPAWKVAPLRSRVSTRTAVWALSSVPAGGAAELTVTVTGAQLGDLVTASPASPLPPGIIHSAFVQEANKVTIRVGNLSGSAVSSATITWNIEAVGQ